MWERLSDAASTANGLEPVVDDPPPDPLTAGFVPRLSNGEAAAVLQAWRHAAARSNVAWGLWYELTIYALGWRQEGDRFVSTRAHAKGAFPADMLPLVWAWTAKLAERIDESRAVVRRLYIDTSYRAYEATERQAWEQMKEYRSATGGADVPLIPPVPPIPDEPPFTPPLPLLPGRGGFPWWLLILGIGLALGKGRHAS